ncbi:hypothetical protein [Acidithiobacillus ferriphilus]|uniref:hypothetical protein n=1 Tax=Acidithiobacillus ferriphilus TaxID=1689834 RepID=UPI002DBF6F8E|nr:hypothetical protein [Acidithiobacillus ferriphilus]MEB8475379.1 hypothetical protein [Acidithiobacillus ferriphilus]MEB8535398.1 hypothetical protein [Acidithiobacillus ferriphilus]
MIIKDKPFHVPCCQAMLCWYYASPVVAGLAISSPSGCEVDLVRRWPGFVKLEAYQVRLSRFLVMRRADAVFDRDCDGHFDALLDDYLEAGRVERFVWGLL